MPWRQDAGPELIQAARAEWPFAGRDAELDVITAALAPKGPGDAGANGAVVVAPAGVGKTRLLREVRRWADARGIRTETVIATEAASRTPYGAVLHLLPPELGASSDRAGWHAAFAAALRSEQHRTVLLVDDAHLLDEGSAALLLQLVLEDAVAPVVAARRGRPVPDPVTLLWKDRLCLRVDLQPFSVGEMSELIARVLGGPVSDRTLTRLARVSDGNVLFARELVTAAVEGGSLRPGDGVLVWDERVLLAPRLVDAVGARLETLTAAQRRALALVALGEPLPPTVAERLAEPELWPTVEEEGLIRLDDTGEESALRLAHPLYGEVVLERLGGLGRRRLAAALADAFEADPRHAEEDVVRIVTWQHDAGRRTRPEVLLRAAARANQTFDHTLAVRLAQAALDALDCREAGAGQPGADEPGDGQLVEGAERRTRVSTVIELARAEVGCNAVERAHALLTWIEHDILDAVATDPTLVDTYLDTLFQASYLGLGRAQEFRGLLDRLCEGTGADVDRLRRRVAPYLASIVLGEGRPRQALEIVEPLLDATDLSPLQHLVALATAGESMGYLGLHRRAEGVWSRMRSVAGGSDRVLGAAVEAELQTLFSAMLDGRVADVLPVVTAFHDKVENSPDVVNRGLACLGLGSCLVLGGQLERARTVLLDAVADFRKLDLGGSLGWSLITVCTAAALTGRLAAARQLRQEAREAFRRSGTARQAADFVVADVWLAAAEGDHTTAAALARKGADEYPEMVLHRAWLLHLACRVGDRSREVAGALRQIAGSVECALPALLADHAEALRTDDGRALLSVADRFVERGLTLLAAEAATQAARAYRVAGSTNGTNRASALARSLGRKIDPVRTPALDDPGPLVLLSRREQDVARLAASGMSNAAIAERLVVSVRTVESHLYQVFAKLGVQSRTELGRFLSAPARDDR